MCLLTVAGGTTAVERNSFFLIPKFEQTCVYSHSSIKNKKLENMDRCKGPLLLIGDESYNSGKLKHE
jgi:hypothetical protein